MLEWYLRRPQYCGAASLHNLCIFATRRIFIMIRLANRTSTSVVLSEVSSSPSPSPSYKFSSTHMLSESISSSGARLSACKQLIASELEASEVLNSREFPHSAVFEYCAKDVPLYLHRLSRQRIAVYFDFTISSDSQY
jgi:hypothetical protein